MRFRVPVLGFSFIAFGLVKLFDFFAMSASCGDQVDLMAGLSGATSACGCPRLSL